jgi:hypothetical protein
MSTSRIAIWLLTLSSAIGCSGYRECTTRKDCYLGRATDLTTSCATTGSCDVDGAPPRFASDALLLDAGQTLTIRGLEHPSRVELHVWVTPGGPPTPQRADVRFTAEGKSFDPAFLELESDAGADGEVFVYGFPDKSLANATVTFGISSPTGAGTWRVRMTGVVGPIRDCSVCFE